VILNTVDPTKEDLLQFLLAAGLTRPIRSLMSSAP
jgi:hypothetical protein